MTPLVAIETAPKESAEPSSAESSHLQLAGGRSVTRRRLGLSRGATLLITQRYDPRRPQRLRFAFIDCAALIVALAVCLQIFGKADSIVAIPGALLIALVICVMSGAYETADVGLHKSALDEAPLLMVLSGLTALANTIMLPLLVGSELNGRQVAGLWLGLFVALSCGRSLSRLLSRTLCEAQRCIVIGEVEQAELIRERFQASRVHADVVAAVPLSLELLQEPEQDLEVSIRNVAHELHAGRIIIAPSQETLHELPRLIRIAKAIGVAVSMVPGTFDYVGHSVEVEDVNGMALIGIRPFGLSPIALLLKRGLDLVLSAALLLILSPGLLLIALAIKFDSPGAIFFRQARVGRDGQQFQIIKFRSMVAGAEEHKNELRALSEAGEGLFKIADDPRVTRIGGFLRRSSLDELPQLLNVVRGEMSLVGPRPLVVDEDRSILGLDRSRLKLMPGMTGPWQILRKRVSRPEMVEIDYRYVASWSLWLDVKILARTALHVARRGNV